MDATRRQEVRVRANGRCEYCRLPQAAVYLRFHVEHVIARQHGGTDELSNLALACDRCNLCKGPNIAAIDPAGGALVRLFNPRTDDWETHFLIHNGTIEGLTEIGRVTVALLQMNAEHRVLLRKFLALHDEL
jgi:hypothetical protein